MNAREFEPPPANEATAMLYDTSSCNTRRAYILVRMDPTYTVVSAFGKNIRDDSPTTENPNEYEHVIDWLWERPPHRLLSRRSNRNRSIQPTDEND